MISIGEFQRNTEILYIRRWLNQSLLSLEDSKKLCTVHPVQCTTYVVRTLNRVKNFEVENNVINKMLHASFRQARVEETGWSRYWT